MMKFQTLCLSLMIATAALLAPSKTKAQAFEEGSNYVQVGYGFVTLMGAISSTFDDYTNVKINNMGPLYLKYERAISDRIGLGLNIAYASNSWSYDVLGYNSNTYQAEYSRSTYSVLARFNYHFSDSDKFDPYVGLGLGYRNANWEFSSNDPDGGGEVSLSSLMPLGMELTVGARYFFSDNIGAYAEIGAAKSVVQLGLAAKF